MPRESSVPIQVSHRHARAGGEGAVAAPDDWGWLRMIERTPEADTSQERQRASVYVCPACGDEVLVELAEAFSLADEP